MMISPTFVLWSTYLICKIIQLAANLIWYLLVALWWLASWPFKAAAHRRERNTAAAWAAQQPRWQNP